MVSALSTDNLPSWLQTAIFWVEDQIWREAAETDTSTPAFYVYKPYPSSLKKNQMQDWAALQKRVLSPFSGGDTYMFAGSKGVAFWASPTAFGGIPETAAQAPLEDGEFFVKGKSLCYQQRWRDRVMIQCVVVECPDPFDGLSLDTAQRRAWAKTHPLNDAVTKPAFWAVVGCLLALLMLLWLAVGAATLWFQGSALESKAARIESALGDKLAMQSEFQQSQALLEGIYSWQSRYAHLPQTLSVAIDAVLEQGNWRADTIEWQSNTLRIELVSPDLDISGLVQTLENTGGFSQVAIRPHTNANTWNLEVTVNESEFN